MMWLRFTERARRAIFYAQEEAQCMGESQVSTEHLLLGLIRETDSVAAYVLDRLGVSLPRIRAEIERLAPRGDARLRGEMQLTARAKRVIDLAYDEARQLNNNYVGTEHLLLGLIREGEGLAARVLYRLGVTLENARHIMQQIQRREPDTPLPPIAPVTRHSATPMLEILGSDLTQQARQGRLTPVLEREAEISQLLQILAKQTHHNPLLIGPCGVGKTTLVNGIAISLAHGEVPQTLRNRRVLAFTHESLILQMSDPSVATQLLQELRRAQDELILFIDNLEGIFEPSLDTRSTSLLQVLRALLYGGTLRCIGAFNISSPEDEQRLSLLTPLFQPVRITEPSPEATLRILMGLRSHYQLLYAVSISDEAIRAAVDLAVRCLPDQHLPAKAIDLLESAVAALTLQSTRPPLALYHRLSEGELLRLLIQTLRTRDPASERLSTLEAELQQVQQSLQQLEGAVPPPQAQAGALPLLTAEHIVQEVHRRTDIPIDQLLQDHP